jgi:subtilisin family serine protease
MRTRLFKLLMPTLLVLTLLLSGAISAAGDGDPGPPRFIVVIRPGADAGDVAAGLGVAVSYVYSHALNGFAAPLPAAQLRALKADPRVAYVEPDLVVHTCEGQTLPTGVDRIDVDFNATADIDNIDDRVDVDIAIIDTGIDQYHPDLDVVGGRRFYTIATGAPWNRGTFADENYDDDNGHGSHVAGTAAALDNTEGVVGVAPGARLWAVKVLDASGSGYLSDVIAGIDWVTGKADVIEVANMSLSWQGNSSAARTAIQNSVEVGVVYVVAAGNDASDVYGLDGSFGTSDDIEPAAYPEVATISAMADSDGQPGGTGGDTSYGNDDSFASFSNFSASVVDGNPVTSPGAAIDLLMPGVDIYSTYMGDGYAKGSGTSMASPHAAGLAALYIAANGRATDATAVHAIRQALIDSGVAQNGPQGLATLNDPDDNLENIGWAGPLGSVDYPPTVNITNPENGVTVSGTVTVTIDATDIEDPAGTLTVTWSVDGGSWHSATYISDTGYYEASWDTTAGVDDGSHTVNASATDSAGNTGNDSNNVAVDNVNDPPVADAGPDQTVVDEDGDGFETVTLDATGGGPVAFDTASSASTDSDADTLSWSHTTSGSDHMMIVGVTTRSNRSVTSLTYNGISLAKIRHDNPGSDVRTESWYLIAPNEGTHTVNLAVEDTTTIEAGATTWASVGQTAATALGTNAGATGLGSIASVEVASASGEVVVDVVGTQNAGATVTVGDGQTERWNQVGTAGVGAASSEPGAGTVTMSWDLAQPESWAISAVTLLSAGGSYDPDGTIVSYEWKEDDQLLGETPSITVNFTVGMHTVTLTVTDDEGATGTDTVVVTVSEAAETMHIATIEMSLKVAGINRNAVAVVTIHDISDNPVPGATVYGTWSDATDDTDSGLTDANGTVLLESDKVKNAPSGTTFTLTVTNVVLDGWTYDGAADVETSDSISIE